MEESVSQSFGTISSNISIDYDNKKYKIPFKKTRPKQKQRLNGTVLWWLILSYITQHL